MSLMSREVMYLGLPTFWGCSKGEAYNYLFEKSLMKMQGWKNKNLKPTGKETMIKSVQAIPSYAMACFALPKKFCNKLSSSFQISGGVVILKIRFYIG